jgi:5-epi-alpha-selinene synthase
VHNLVVVLRQEHALSLQEAVDEAARIFNARMRDYVELEQRLPSLGVEIDGRLQRYLTGLRCWVRGNMDWSYESGRYGQMRPEVAATRYGS